MLDEDAKMEIIQNALAQNYQGNFTDLFIQQEQAMQQQQQGQPQQQEQQEMQQPSQPMPASMPQPAYEGTGDLVQSYQDAPPGMSNNPMGENVSGVVSDASSYETGGMYKVSDMVEYESGGAREPAQVDDYVKKLRANVKKMGWKQTGGQRSYMSRYKTGGEEKTEGQRRRELKSAISNVSTNSREKKLLEVTNYMENSMGYNPAAYGRNYTNSQASIDPIMLNDLFDQRVDKDGKKQGYSTTQKKYFKRFEALGLPTEKEAFKAELNSDNAEAAIEAMRMVYGRSPEAIPAITDTSGMFDYYNNNYRRNNEIKDLTKSKERFYEGYKKEFKRGGEHNPTGKMKMITTGLLHPTSLFKKQLPINLRQFTYDLFGGDETVTENDLNSREKKALEKARKNAEKRGSNKIEYQDYQTNEDGESVYADVDSSKDNQYSKEKDPHGLAPVKKLFNSSYALKTTFGQMAFKKNKDGTYTYDDQYNFNNATKEGGIKNWWEGAKKEGLDVYGQLRNIATNFGSKPGEGSKVKIKMKRGGYKSKYGW